DRGSDVRDDRPRYAHAAALGRTAALWPVAGGSWASAGASRPGSDNRRSAANLAAARGAGIANGTARAAGTASWGSAGGRHRAGGKALGPGTLLDERRISAMADAARPVEHPTGDDRAGKQLPAARLA